LFFLFAFFSLAKLIPDAENQGLSADGSEQKLIGISAREDPRFAEQAVPG